MIQNFYSIGNNVWKFQVSTLFNAYLVTVANSEAVYQVCEDVHFYFIILMWNY